jgi:hypothetical protein
MKTKPLGRAWPALCALALWATAATAGAQTIVPVLPSQDLATLINDASPNSRFRLEGNSSYVLSGDVFIKASNSPVSIEGPGGLANLPNNTKIILGPHRFDIEDGNSLTLADLALEGGASSVIVPLNSRLKAARVFFTAGVPRSVRLLGRGDFSSCVFANGLVGIRNDGGTANVVQCTFIGTTPGIQHTNGTLNLVANLFATVADAPQLGPLVGPASRWYGNLVGTDNTVPSAFTGGTQPANPVITPTIAFSTDANAWPGKLDPNLQPPLYAGSLTASGPASILDNVDGLDSEDFEGDARLTQIQIGADELNSGQRVGWISSRITTDSFRPDGLAVAGKSEVVSIDIEVRGISLNNARLLVVPELGSEADPDTYTEINVNQVATGIGRATYNAPATSCTNDQLYDGRAQLILRLNNGTVLRGTTSNLEPQEYQFIIDTTPPVLGVYDNQYLLEGTLLSSILISDDPLLAASLVGGYPAGWGPVTNVGALGQGNHPANGSTLGSATNNPQVFFSRSVLGDGPTTFTLPMQFVDDPAPLCGNATVSSVDVAGFDSAQPSPVILIATGFNPGAPGRPVLVGEIPDRLASADFELQVNAPGSIVADVMDASWTFRNFGFTPGWRADLTPGATDLANNRYEHPKPLEFWWLDEALLDATTVSLTGPGDPENPAFSWSLAGSPPRDDKVTSPCVPVVSYRLWRADDVTNPNTGYTADDDWSDYVNIETIDRATIFPSGERLDERLARVNNQNQGMMLTILIADEAGNLQEKLAIPGTETANAINTNRIGDVAQLYDEAIIPFVTWGNSQDLTDTVDTRMRAKLFWNRVDALGNLRDENGAIHRVESNILGERDFGSSTRLPLPTEDCDAGVFTRVEGQFFVTAEGTGAPITRRISWQLLEEGRVVAEGILCTRAESGYRGVVQIPEDLRTGRVEADDAIARFGYAFENFVAPGAERLQSSGCDSVLSSGIQGDRLGDEGKDSDNKRRRSIKYLFRAATIVETGPNPNDPNCNDGFTIEEETPATFQFTVTPADEFDSGEQPVKVFAPK